MRFVAVFIVFFTVFTVESTLASEKNISPECLLTAGFDEANPFHFRNDKGLVVGFDADILREALGLIGCQVEFRELPWARTLLYTEEGTIDIAIGAGFQAKRAQWAYYSVPYKFINHWLYTRADKHTDVDSIETFFKQKLALGVVIGWGYPVDIRNLLGVPEYSKFINKVSKFPQLPIMLDADRIDGIIAIPEMLRTEILTNKVLNQFAPRAKYKEELHFMFSKKSVPAKTVADFNNALYQLIYSGRWNDILMKYKLN